MIISTKSIRLCTLVFLSIFISCSDKKGKGSEDIWVAPEPSDTIAYSERISINDTVTIGGKQLTYNLTIEPEDSLPIITSYSGQRFKDNGVDLTIRNDSSQILKRHFTKDSFSDFVSSGTLKEMSLVDFYKNSSKTDTGSNLYFLCKIGDPEDTDENFNFIEIRVSNTGDIQMEKAKWDELSTEPLTLDNSKRAE